MESVHFNNCLVWLRYKIRNQKNTEDSSGSWKDYWCTLQELYTSRVIKRAQKITLDLSHSCHLLFELLPSGWRYRAPNTRTVRHKNSFFPQVIYLINGYMFSHCAIQMCNNLIYSSSPYILTSYFFIKFLFYSTPVHTIVFFVVRVCVCIIHILFFIICVLLLFSLCTESCDTKTNSLYVQP